MIGSHLVFNFGLLLLKNQGLVYFVISEGGREVGLVCGAVKGAGVEPISIPYL